MNEGNYWGCFYIFPELYADDYTPTVVVRSLSEVPQISDGKLTKDVVSACISYLRCCPILKKYVYIKLNIASMVRYSI